MAPMLCSQLDFSLQNYVTHRQTQTQTQTPLPAWVEVQSEVIFMNETKEPIRGFSYMKVGEEAICSVESRYGPSQYSTS
jgi:hypothetical protein